jgi:RsiW-degrading membrane proteinase PrsW (M82 family)
VDALSPNRPASDRGPTGESLKPLIVIPALVAVGVPVAFLVAIRRCDAYASSDFGLVLVCFAFGMAAFPIAYALNTLVRDLLLGPIGLDVATALLLVRVVGAPVVEELAKSVGLAGSMRSPDFTYFVDGAILGFAAGTAFAVIENLHYLGRTGLNDGLPLSINRAFSTSLMHGTACALVGVSLGRLRFGRSRLRYLALPIGLIAAIGLHVAFNSLVIVGSFGLWKLALAFGVGLGGVGLIGLLILGGLREEREWLRESLGLEVGVTQSEASVVERLADLSVLLAPVAARFGPAKRDQVAALLRLQARLGLKRAVCDRTSDERCREQLLSQIDELQQRQDCLRRAIGLYCMAYVRSILPPETETLWDSLRQALAEKREPGLDIWETLGDQAGG